MPFLTKTTISMSENASYAVYPALLFLKFYCQCQSMDFASYWFKKQNSLDRNPVYCWTTSSFEFYEVAIVALNFSCWTSLGYSIQNKFGRICLMIFSCNEAPLRGSVRPSIHRSFEFTAQRPSYRHRPFGQFCCLRKKGQYWGSIKMSRYLHVPWNHRR